IMDRSGQFRIGTRPDAPGSTLRPATPPGPVNARATETGSPAASSSAARPRWPWSPGSADGQWRGIPAAGVGAIAPTTTIKAARFLPGTSSSRVPGSMLGGVPSDQPRQTGATRDAASQIIERHPELARFEQKYCEAISGLRDL